MNEVIVKKASINPEALDSALRLALGSAVSGFSYNNGQVTVHLADDATAQQITQVQQIVANHDPAVLTAAQQTEVNRQLTLEQARQAAGALQINPTDFAGKQQDLARKVILLEQELRDLRQRLGAE